MLPSFLLHHMKLQHHSLSSSHQEAAAPSRQGHSALTEHASCSCAQVRPSTLAPRWSLHSAWWCSTPTRSSTQIEFGCPPLQKQWSISIPNLKISPFHYLNTRTSVCHWCSWTPRGSGYQNGYTPRCKWIWRDVWGLRVTVKKKFTHMHASIERLFSSLRLLQKTLKKVKQSTKRGTSRFSPQF